MNETVDLNQKKKSKKNIYSDFSQKNFKKNLYINSAKFLSISIHKSQI